MGRAERASRNKPSLPHEATSALSAIFLGAVTAIGGSVVSGAICGAVYASSLARHGLSAENIVIAAYRLEPTSWVFVTSAMFAFAFSILGGYVCGWMSRQFRQRHVLILAAIVASLEFFATAGRYSLGLRIAMCVGLIIFIEIGAVLARARLLRQSA